MNDIATPHDTFFRESFGRREIACDFLRCRLPPALLADIDLATLEIAKDTYVSSDLRSAYSDLVYRLRHRDGPLHVYLLFEHKSWPEHWTPLQLLRYVTAEGEQFRKQHPEARHLPPVYTIVVYPSSITGRVLGRHRRTSMPSSSRCRRRSRPSCRASATTSRTCPAAPTPRSRARY
ncbi:Rpn family recombination-promoting nuclease/putative transposase [Thiohalocapsa sp. ML1]|uniref:Rpn family recombination-promoting nuclease/putative transposase n=1 Tax=Thiohalocapsa sp. ML1 TaxID=1431688 RepID=UPI0007320AAF|nr:Rpn family recombination-promoting nuclease/putative transposase [Thiohalocapsa sp. ML1]